MDWIDTGTAALRAELTGDGPATLEVARPMLPRIRALGIPAALVAQPGTTTDAVPWDDVDVLFVGGPDPWQHSEELLELVREGGGRQRDEQCRTRGPGQAG